MKVVLLAGGFGTRISEESHLKPKPMIEIGGKPILWHIMKEYSHYGYNDFIICCGYKQYVIKEWFADYALHNSVTLVDTGLNTMTGGRVKRIQPYVGDETFMLTYGDGVCDVNINELVKFHQSHGKIATMTSVSVGQRFGVLDIDENNTIRAFREKQDSDGSRINAGYMVLEPKIFDFIEGDSTVFEKAPLEKCAELGELKAYNYNGFWQCMDTKREMEKLEELWQSGKAPWKSWE